MLLGVIFSEPCDIIVEWNKIKMTTHALRISVIDVVCVHRMYLVRNWDIEHIAAIVMFQQLLQSCVLIFKQCLHVHHLHKLHICVRPKKGNQAVLSQYAYEIWLHILVHQSGNFPFKAAGMKSHHFAWKFQLGSYRGITVKFLSISEKMVPTVITLEFGLRRTVLLIPATL